MIRPLLPIAFPQAVYDQSAQGSGKAAMISDRSFWIYNIVTENRESPCDYIGSSKMQVHPVLRPKPRAVSVPLMLEKSAFV